MTLIDENLGQGMTGLLGLPIELFREIADHLTRVELKSLRLVCSDLRDCTTPLIFTTAVCVLRQGVFEAFKSLSNDPELGQHVTEIVYDLSSLDPDTVGHYASGITPVDARHKDPTSREGRANYIKLFFEQESIREDELATAVQHAVQNFPKLRRLIIADYIRSPYFQWDRVEDLGEDFHLSGDWNSRALFGTEVPNGRPLTSLLSEDIDFRRQYLGLTTLLRALSQQQCRAKIDDLRIGDTEHSRGSGGIPDVVLEALLDWTGRPSTAFGSLRKLDITISQSCKGSDSSDRTIFPPFPHLELLRLIGPIRSPREGQYAPTLREPTIRFPDCCGEANWPKLRALELKWIAAKKAGLLAFFGRHRDTLRFINLQEIYIHGKNTFGTLVGTLRSIYPNLAIEPAQKFQDLRHAPWIPGHQIINFTLYGEEAILTNMSDDGFPNDYYEDTYSNYSADRDPYEEEERYSSEELDYSEGGDEIFENEYGNLIR